ncbi:hypothetical protein [Agrobacterium tumefaciens]|uniref:Uncharacterized protein n=1 Tax=Agrobacterium tumefaciens TaxID=358 RepID=A0A2L2LIE7_AGRTU|nr:hypothetical protein [Agrobacterium tumefaciens]AVH44008.1 hypothetical protein At1D1609_39610 [Agrobacterium tumefaciens]NSY97940.1 hypothetical protein [Agrobacterium tumefaciens]
MASTLKPLVPLPPPSQPVVDAGGRMNKDWYLYLKELDRHLREVEERATAGGL